jgi:hypothetical protein
MRIILDDQDRAPDFVIVSFQRRPSTREPRTRRIGEREKKISLSIVDRAAIEKASVRV